MNTIATSKPFPIRRFAGITALVCLSLVAAVAAFNAVIDPFDMDHWVDIKGFNAVKPAIYTRVRLFKAYQVARVRPQSLILGTSRSHIGFRCSHPAWAKMAGPCYNLAFDGATSREMYAYLRHAYAIRPLKHVLLGLEPYHLAPSLSTTRPDFDPLVLRDPDGNVLPRWLTGELRIFTSLDTLEASLQTLEDRNDPSPDWFGPRGQREGDVFFRQIDGRYRQLSPEGYFHMTDRKEVGYETEWQVAARHSHTGLRADPPPDPDRTSEGYVRRIVAFCRSHHIDLRIVVTPAHVHQLEIMAASTGWTEVERKKRDLVRLVAEENARYPDEPPTPVYDFSGYSSITEEAPPPAGSQREMRYYWDSSHFKQVVGDYVLDRVYGITDPAHPAPAGFGVKLTTANIESYLASQRVAQAEYRQQYPGDYANLRELVANALKGDRG